MSLSNLFELLKSPEPRDNNTIKSLARKVPLEETYKRVDVLTLTIYFQHKDAFHIILERGVNLNPYAYKDVPPILWALEISDTYYFETLIEHPNLDLFIRSNVYEENIISNMVLKLHNIDLFHKTFQLMRKKDEEKLQKLIGLDITISNENSYPLYICLRYLNDNYKYTKYCKEKLEKCCLQKIKILLEFQNKIEINKTNHYSCVYPVNILEYLINNTELIQKTPRFIRQLLSYLQTFPDFTECLQKYKKCLYHCVSHNNIELTKYFIDLGANTDIDCQDNSLSEAIKKDNLEIVKLLLTYGYQLDAIYPKSSQINRVTIPDNYRNIHLAVAYGSFQILNYIISKIGDHLDYKGICGIFLSLDLNCLEN